MKRFKYIKSFDDIRNALKADGIIFPEQYIDEETSQKWYYEFKIVDGTGAGIRTINIQMFDDFTVKGEFGGYLTELLRRNMISNKEFGREYYIDLRAHLLNEVDETMKAYKPYLSTKSKEDE